MDDQIEVLSLSLLTNPIIVDKIKSELNNTDDTSRFDGVLEEIKNMNVLCRQLGIYHLKNYINQTNNQFIKGILILMRELITEKNTQMFFVSNILYSYMLLDNLLGDEFIEALLVYEAMLMIIVGTPQELINIKMNGILGRKLFVLL